MATLDKTAVESSANVSLTVRLIMQGKEVGSIIGKKGEIVKRFRDESGAKINISDGSCPERIVTVTGHTDSIYKAFKLICNKFEEDLANLVSPATVPRPPITFRLIVPASQCGSLIGKGGSKIKEIREVTGASIQVASEMLPNSTERAVTISGSSDAVTQCVYHICSVMSESPPKGITVPYRPLKPVTAVPGLGMAGATAGSPVVSQNAAAAAAAAVAAAATSQAASYNSNGAGGHTGHNAAAVAAAAAAALNNPSAAAAAAALLPGNQAGKLGSIPLAGLSGLNGLGGFPAGGLSHAALAALAGHQNRPQSSQQTHEMTVPNELIGCIIGKGGSKIAEIRQLSGAMIRISNCEDRESGGNMDRTITITGNPESVALAQYLINMSMELHKANLEAQNQAIAVASSHPTASGSGLLPAPALTSLYKHPTTQLINTAAVTTNTVNGGVMSTSTSSNNHQPANQPEAAAALLAQLTAAQQAAAAQAAQQQQHQQHTQNPFLFMVPQTPTEVAAVSQQPQIQTYQVTPKLKAPSGLIAVSSGRGTDKFSPY